MLGFGAIGALPRLFGSAFLIVAAFYFPIIYYSAGQAPAVPTAASQLLGAAGQIGITLVIASVLIGVHRFTLLEEQTDRLVWTLPSTYPRFALSLVVVDCFTLPASLFSGLFVPQHSVAFGIVNAVYVIVGIMVFLRTVLLFPALAVGSPYARWKNSWRDTSGHVWRMIGTGFLVGIPIFIVSIVLSAVSIVVFVSVVKQTGSIPLWLSNVAGSGMVAITYLPTASIGAVIASRYFQRYGNALIYPPHTAIPR